MSVRFPTSTNQTAGGSPPLPSKPISGPRPSLHSTQASSLQRQPVKQISCMQWLVQKLSSIWNRICCCCSIRAKPRAAAPVVAPPSSTGSVAVSSAPVNLLAAVPGVSQDEQIRDIFLSNQRRNVIVDYVWGGQTCRVRILNNPAPIVLFGAFVISQRYVFATKEKDVPDGLGGHLRGLLPPGAPSNDFMMLFGMEFNRINVFNALEGK